MAGKKNKPYGAIIVLTALIVAYLFFNFYSFKNNDAYAIGRVEINGNKLISRSEILTIIGDIKLDSLNDSQVIMLQNTLKSNRFVKEAWVKISPPSTLIINISEFVPEAIILNKKNKYYLANDGIIYPYRFINDFKELPIISGINIENKTNLQTTLTVLRIIKERPALYEMISEIFWNNNELNLILTENGIIVELSKDNTNEKIFILDRFLQRNFSSIKKKGYKKINLQYKNKIICS